jgi:hypothetical protein
MEPRYTILNELKAISPTVAEISPHNTYQVPEGYFEGLAETILNRIKASAQSPKEELESISPLLNKISRKTPYEVPQDYFGELSETVVGGIQAIDFVKGELQHISPLMDNLRHKNVYQVPEGYFENLAGNILDKIKNQRQPAKVVSMGRKIMRYAVAAMVAGIMAIGGWLYFSGDNVTGDVANIEKISDDAKVSEEEMNKFLENGSLTATVSTVAFDTEAEMSETDVKEMLTDVSDDELQQYLTTL